MSSPLSTASIKPIQTLSLETILEYVIAVRVLVVCPPAQNLAFLVKSILISKTMWQPISGNPIISFAVPDQTLSGYIITGFPHYLYL
jgi:hypothetical protein